MHQVVFGMYKDGFVAHLRIRRRDEICGGAGSGWPPINARPQFTSVQRGGGGCFRPIASGMYQVVFKMYIDASEMYLRILRRN